MDVISISLIFIIVYLYLKWHFSYWKRKGVDYIEPDFIFGNIKQYALRNLSLGDDLKNLYNTFKARGAKHGGIFCMLQPTYMPIDLEIVKSILIKDFNSFKNRGLYINEDVDPLSGNLFFLEGEKWKKLRQKLTPAFSSGKTKMMLTPILACTENMHPILKKYLNSEEPVDMKELMASYTVEVIGSTVFGIDARSFENENCGFKQCGEDFFQNHNIIARIKVLISTMFPKTLLTKIGYKAIPDSIESFIVEMVSKTVEYREQNNILKKDLLHLLVQLKNRGKIADDNNIFADDKGNDFITMKEIAAQCFVFLIAGYESSANTLTFLLLEVALNETIQERLREEIKSVLEKYDNVICYEALSEMPYLDQVINETFRKHAPGLGSMRVCNTPYQIPGTDIVLDVGTRVVVPFQAIQMDPDNFPDPEKFDPERFTEENRSKIRKCSFLPFGEGPRMCIGRRLGVLQIKAGVVTILNNYKVAFNKKTKLPITHDPTSVPPAVSGGVWLNVSEL